jgi:hypothetical protein
MIIMGLLLKRRRRNLDLSLSYQSTVASYFSAHPMLKRCNNFEGFLQKTSSFLLSEMDT